MEHRTYRAAIVTLDARLGEQLQAALRTHPQIQLTLELRKAPAGLDESELRRLRETNPELVLLDLAHDAGTAIEFARWLMEQNSARRIVGLGPALESQNLLHAMRAGICEYLHQPVAPEELSDAIQRVVRLLGGAAADQRRSGRVFSFFAAKGGDGTTLVATNVAIELHRLTGKPTILVDLDIELGEVALVLGLEARHSLVDLAKNLHRLDPDLLASYVQPHDSGIHVLPAPLYPAPEETVGADPIRSLLAFLRRHYAFIVVDTARIGGAHTLAALERSDRIVAVTQPHLSSLRNLKRCAPLLQRLGARDADRIRLVLNRHDPASEISLREVQDALDLRVHRTLDDDAASVERARNRGVPVVMNQTSTLAREIRELAADLAGLELERARRRLRLRTLAAPVLRIRRRFTRTRPPVLAHD